MGIVTASFRLYPSGIDLVGQWTPLGTITLAAEHYKEVRQTAKEHEPPSEVAPSTAKGLSSSTKELKDAWFLEALGNYLPAGSTFIECLKLSIHWNVKVTSTGAKAGKLTLEDGEGHALVSSENAAGSGTAAWQTPVSLTEAAAKALTAAQLGATSTGSGPLPFFVGSLKANKIEVFSAYVEVEVKYEEASGAEAVSLSPSAAAFSSTTSFAGFAVTPLTFTKGEAVTAELLVATATTPVQPTVAVSSDASTLASHATTPVSTSAATGVAASSLAILGATPLQLASAVGVTATQLALFASTTLPLASSLASANGLLAVGATTPLALSPAAPATAESLSIRTASALALAAVDSSADSLALSVGSQTEVVPVPAVDSSSGSLTATAVSLVVAKGLFKGGAGMWLTTPGLQALFGDFEQGQPTNLSSAVGIAFYTKFTVKQTGHLSELWIFCRTGGSAELAAEGEVTICADNGTGEAPATGTVLESHTIAPGASSNVWVKLNCSLHVTEGEVLWVGGTSTNKHITYQGQATFGAEGVWEYLSGVPQVFIPETGTVAAGQSNVLPVNLEPLGASASSAALLTTSAASLLAAAGSSATAGALAVTTSGLLVPSTAVSSDGASLALALDHSVTLPLSVAGALSAASLSAQTGAVLLPAPGQASSSSSAQLRVLSTIPLGLQPGISQTGSSLAAHAQTQLYLERVVAASGGALVLRVDLAAFNVVVVEFLPVVTLTAESTTLALVAAPVPAAQLTAGGVPPLEPSLGVSTPLTLTAVTE